MKNNKEGTQIPELKDLRPFFSEKGIKMTPQRIAVYQALLKLKHPCVEEIAEDVHKSNPTITIATIYNILEFFCEKGIIAKMRTNSGKMHYETHPQPHHHICDETKDVIEDYYDEELNKLIKAYFNKKNLSEWEILDFHLYLHGKYNGNVEETYNNK